MRATRIHSAIHSSSLGHPGEFVAVCLRGCSRAASPHLCRRATLACARFVAAPEAARARAAGGAVVHAVDRTPLRPYRCARSRRGAAIPRAGRPRGDSRRRSQRCLYAQRTAENSEAFSAIFAILKIGPDDEAAVRAYAPHAPPGWLAWARDDFFHADAASSIDLSCRLLSQFAEGSSECVICLERILDPPQRRARRPARRARACRVAISSTRTAWSVCSAGRRRTPAQCAAPPLRSTPRRARCATTLAPRATTEPAGTTKPISGLALDLEARRLEEEARCGACCTIS